MKKLIKKLKSLFKKSTERQIIDYDEKWQTVYYYKRKHNEEILPPSTEERLIRPN